MGLDAYCAQQDSLGTNSNEIAKCYYAFIQQPDFFFRMLGTYGLEGQITMKKPGSRNPEVLADISFCSALPNSLGGSKDANNRAFALDSGITCPGRRSLFEPLEQGSTSKSSNPHQSTKTAKKSTNLSRHSTWASTSTALRVKQLEAENIKLRKEATGARLQAPGRKKAMQTEVMTSKLRKLDLCKNLDVPTALIPSPEGFQADDEQQEYTLAELTLMHQGATKFKWCFSSSFDQECQYRAAAATCDDPFTSDNSAVMTGETESGYVALYAEAGTGITVSGSSQYSEGNPLSYDFFFFACHNETIEVVQKGGPPRGGKGPPGGTATKKTDVGYYTFPFGTTPSVYHIYLFSLPHAHSHLTPIYRNLQNRHMQFHDYIMFSKSIMISKNR